MAFKALTVNTPPAQAAHILAEDDAAIYGGLLGQDCVLPLGQKLKATVISNNKVRIADGVVSVGGHIGRVISGDYEDMTIANGVSGKKRNDIIAARFIAGASGGADTYKLVVIQGTAGTTASDPVTVKGDLYSGDKQRDYPLWRVKIEGLSIVKVEQMYKVGVSDTELLERMTEMNRSLTEKITAINSSLENLKYYEYKLSSGDYYYEKDICFYKSCGSVTVYNFGIKMKVSIALNRFTTIGYIPQYYTPGADITFPVMDASKGEYVGMMQLGTNGDIRLCPLIDVIGMDLLFSATYINYN